MTEYTLYILSAIGLWLVILSPIIAGYSYGIIKKWHKKLAGKDDDDPLADEPPNKSDDFEKL